MKNQHLDDANEIVAWVENGDKRYFENSCIDPKSKDANLYYLVALRADLALTASLVSKITKDISGSLFYIKLCATFLFILVIVSIFKTI